jgi:holo-[acyl-carrier protein] synthase
MIVGVGIDVVDVERFESSLLRTPGLRTRLFTSHESERAIASLAARFAAKEALAKALGAPEGLHWADAEVRSDESGRPSLRLTGSVAARAQQLSVGSVHVSLSHDAGIASAVVVLES